MNKIIFYLQGVSLVMLAGVFLLTGCANQAVSGIKFDYNNVKNIKNGVTTKVEVLRNFGEPFQKNIAIGKETWTYFYRVSDLKTNGAAFIPVVNLFVAGSDMKVEGRNLSLVFEKDIVKECVSTYNSSASRSSMREGFQTTAPTTNVTELCGN